LAEQQEIIARRILLNQKGTSEFSFADVVEDGRERATDLSAGLDRSRLSGASTRSIPVTDALGLLKQ
jgi:hypothetical protein